MTEEQERAAFKVWYFDRFGWYPEADRVTDQDLLEAWQARAALSQPQASEPIALRPYIYGREAGANEKVWTEAAVLETARQAVREALAAAPQSTPDPAQLGVCTDGIFTRMEKAPVTNEGLLYICTAMKRVEMYRWKTLWLGKMSPTRFHATEEDIKRTHPEAVRIEGTLIVRMVPETDDERTPLHSSPPMPNR